MRLTFVFLLITQIVFGQNSNSFNTKANPTNFNKVMAIEQATNAQLDSILLLIQKYSISNLDSSLLLGNKALELSKRHPGQNVHAEIMLETSILNGLVGNQDKSAQMSKEVINIGKSLGNEKLIARANNNLGDIDYQRGAYDSALNYFILAAESWEKIGDKLSEAKAYNNIGSVFFDINDMPKVDYYYKKSMVIADQLENDDLRVIIGSSKALNLMTYGIQYYLEHQMDSLNQEAILDTLNLYFKKSEAKYIEILDIARKLEPSEILILTLNNYVALNINMEKFDLALNHALEAEKLSKKLGDINLLIQSKFNLSSLYRRFKEYDKSVKYGEESLELANSVGLERKAFLANRVLYDLYKETGMYEKAIEVLEDKTAYEIKISDAERTKALAEIESKYQTVKKEKKILELSSTNARIERQRNSIIGGGLLFSILGFLGFRFNKIRKERNDKKAFAEALIYAQEEERKRIARDLHDGVGQSLLLIKKQMDNNLQASLENKQIITDTLEEVRSISRDLHPFQLEKFGLTAAIEDVIEKIERSTDIFISKEIENIDKTFDSQKEIHVFRAIQEAFNNIVKHAKASAAKINITTKSNEVIISIMDNGEGFDHEMAIVTNKSLGLRTMNERISSIGGKLLIEQNKPKGTIIKFVVSKEITN